MWLEKFIKKQFISFYVEDEYKTLLQIVKNKKILFTEEKTFEEKKEFEKYVLKALEENPQTYVSTVLLTFNQGVMNSCREEDFIKKEIDPFSVKYICINNKYSFFVSTFELEKIKKEYKFDLDFIYSVFAIIDSSVKEKKNTFYVLVLQKHMATLGYEDFYPLYSDIQTLSLEEGEEESESFEIVEDIDLEDELINDISALDEEDEKKEIESEKITIESEILNNLKKAVKDYYENYSDNFIEKIVILDTIGLDITLTSLIEEELIINCEMKQYDLLKNMNRLSIENV